jgi:hypothetical protein
MIVGANTHRILTSPEIDAGVHATFWLAMARHTRSSIDYRDRGFIGTGQTPSASDDWLLAAAYALAEWAVAYLGPFFWIALAAAYLATELG